MTFSFAQNQPDMDVLFNRLTSELGVSGEQARKGAGLFFRVARDRLDTQDFQDVAERVGAAEVQAAIADAPELEQPRGLLGGLARLSGKDDMQLVSRMIDAFGGLGMNTATLKRFSKIMLEYIEEHGGERVQEIREKLGLG